MTGRDPLDRLDRKILQLVQDEFPLVPRVWEALGKKAGITAKEAFDRVKKLQNGGFIRAIAPILESAKIGTRASTLVGVSVPKGRIREVAAIISAYPGVSHNYERVHHYNLWFTLSAPDMQALDQTLADIQERTGLTPEAFIDLPITRKFKIDVRYTLEKTHGGKTHGCY
jgi:siroheme decarboxylase